MYEQTSNNDNQSEKDTKALPLENIAINVSEDNQITFTFNQKSQLDQDNRY